MVKKADEIKQELDNEELPNAPETTDAGDLNANSDNKSEDLGGLNDEPTKTIDLGRLNLPKFKKFNKGK